MMDIQNQNAGQSAIKIPPLDTSALDLSVEEVNRRLDLFFNTDIPTKATTGMTTTSTNIGTGAAAWGVSLATGLQPLLTAVNAVFVIAVPLNVLTGMQLGSTNIAAEGGLWPGLIDAVAPAMGASGLNAGSVAGFGTANGMASANGTISANAAAWPDIVNGIAGAMGSNGYNAGSSAGYGVANGISDATPAAVGAARSLAEQVNAAMNAVIQPGSPSKVTTKLGKTIPAGLVVSMENGEDDVFAAASSLASAGIRGLDALAERYEDFMKTAPSGTSEALEQYMNHLLTDGDWLNDGLSRFDSSIRDTIRDWGRDVADALGETVDGMVPRDLATRFEDALKRTMPFTGTEKYTSGHGSRVQVPGGVSVEPGTPGGGGGGGTTPPQPTTPTEPEKTIERDLMGIINPVKDAVAALGLGIDIAAKTMFSEEGWKAREQALGLTKALEIDDLFARRAANQSFANGTFIPGTGSRYTEHYGSPLIPDIAKIPDPTKPPVDPTKPGGGVKVKTGFVTPRGQFPNRPNTGGRTQAPVIVQETHYHTTDSRTLYTPEPERFSEMLSAARDGRTASRVLSNARGGRTQSRGLSRT